MPGGLIVRKFRSETIVVQVVDKGFEYRDCRYSSLSAIAQEITGTKWASTPRSWIHKPEPVKHARDRLRPLRGLPFSIFLL